MHIGTPTAVTRAEVPPKLAEHARPQPRPHPRAGLWNLALGAVGIAGLWVLYAFDPATHGFYPQCALYHTTGWLCPGCGGLRAMHQLLHGHLAAAWALNPLAVLLVPVFAWIGLDWCLSATVQRHLPMPQINARAVWIAVAGLVIFGILRNLI